MLRKLIFTALFLFIVVSVAYVLQRSREDRILVETEPVTRQETFRSYVTASGEIVAARYADIGSDIMGKIISLPVVEGQRVRAGQTLARIDAVQSRSDLQAAEELVRVLEAEEMAVRREIESIRSQKDRAEAAFREAELNLRRKRRLLEEGVAPQADIDVAQAAYETTFADVASAQANLGRAEKALVAAGARVAQAKAQKQRSLDTFSKTEIRSPMDGIVSRLQVREGEMVVVGIQNQPGTTLMTISDLSGVDAEVKVAEADIFKVRLGQKAEVVLDALAGQIFPGKVFQVGSSALPTVGTGAAAREFKVLIRLENSDLELRPGLTCDADILTSELRDALTVPLQAVVIREREGIDQTGVFVIDAGRAEFNPVSAGVIGGLQVVIEGIAEGTPVVTGPFQVLRDLQEGELLETE